jgi:PTS system nitrogen regulatory IIA component
VKFIKFLANFANVDILQTFVQCIDVEKRGNLMKNYELLTIEEVSQLLRVSERTVYDWAQKGEIPCGKLGTAWRFRKTDILQWIDKRLVNAPKSTVRLPIPMASILTTDRIAFIEASTKEEAFIQLADLMAASPQVHNRDQLLEHLFQREELMSTGIGLGIGVPHVRLNSVDDLVVAFGICRQDIIDYPSLDDLPIRLIAMIAANAGQHAKHIRALSTVTGILKNPAMRVAVLAAETTEAAYQLLTRED